MERFACSDQTMLEHLSSRDPIPTPDDSANER
jgi:hypothetical protein